MKNILSFWGKTIMIRLTRINGKQFILNCELIETLEETPDTIITTINGKKHVVKESIEEIVKKVIEYKNEVLFINKTC